MVDDAYRAFVWRRLQELPKVHVGRHKAGVTAEQKNAKGKVAARRLKINADAPLEYDTVEVLDDQEASRLTLGELQKMFGSDLRIAIDAEEARLAQTGSRSLVSRKVRS